MKEAGNLVMDQVLQQIAEQVRLREIVSESPYTYLLHPMRLGIILLFAFLFFALNRLAGNILPWPVICLSPFFVMCVVEANRKRSIKHAQRRLSQLQCSIEHAQQRLSQPQ